MHRDCERARQWASTRVDGELSTFERVLLKAHLDGCASCSEFASAIDGLTDALRSAPLEPFEGSVQISRVRSRLRLRLAPAAAAMAISAVGLGSILASSAMQSESVGRTPTPIISVGADRTTPDTINLRTVRALERLAQKQAAARANRSLRGGPVVQER